MDDSIIFRIIILAIVIAISLVISYMIIRWFRMKEEQERLKDYIQYMLEYHIFELRDKDEYSITSTIDKRALIDKDSILITRTYVKNDTQVYYSAGIFNSYDNTVTIIANRDEYCKGKVKSVNHKYEVKGGEIVKYFEEIIEELKFDEMLG